jgi:hypothetical protein
MILGSWSTFDCPTDHEEEAYEWLVEECKIAGAEVRRVNNEHEMGDYPSFEIDCSRYAELYNKYDSIEDGTEEELDEFEELVDKLNEIEERYNEKFKEWL